MPFDDDTAVRQTGDGAYAAAIADGWWAPRGQLGGYVQAIVLRAMQDAAGADRRPRSMTMHFLRPPRLGAVTVQTTVERAGRAMSTITARLAQEDKLLGVAIGAFAAAYDAPDLGGGQMPDVAPAEGRGPSGDAFGESRPPFTDWLTMQHRFGARPFSGADAGETGGWIGPVEERPVDALTVAVLADAWFPAPWPRLSRMWAAPTIDLTLHFRAPLPLDDTILLGRFTNRVVRDGFFDEDGELWAPDGTLVAQSRQLGLLIPLP